ncbi:histone-lysine N-methyltransferase EHMT2-like [Penaeus chinensis]|uniref:histone-lysine N-methyltransferase EHMT2-like n=1 Tax=Penaeus chinensis TaxID=139456 RepID=UPI001FB73EFB|nr:histone-lysine N-methyltransferase EHMT2-like [Penaeus chinensis]
MSSQELHGKGLSSGGGRDPGGARGGGGYRGKKGKRGRGRGRWIRGKAYFHSKGRGLTRGSGKKIRHRGGPGRGKKWVYDDPPVGSGQDAYIVPRAVNRNQVVDAEGPGEELPNTDSVEEIVASGDKVSSIGGAEEKDGLDEEDAEANSPDGGEGDNEDSMEASTQSEDQKNKVLEMMSLQFNSADITEGSFPEAKRGRRISRYTRKRKFDSLEGEDKTPEVVNPQQVSSTPPALSLVGNTITNVLKKIRKEGLENLPMPNTSPAVVRTRRGAQERKSGSEKDSSEETASISEASEVDSKMEENTDSGKNTPIKQCVKRGRGKAKNVADADVGNESGNESPVIPPKNRSKTRSSSEEDPQQDGVDVSVAAPVSAGRGKGRGRGHIDPDSSLALVGRGRGAKSIMKEEVVNKPAGKEEVPVQSKPRGKMRPEAERLEEVAGIHSPSAIGRGRGRTRTSTEDVGGSASQGTSSVGMTGRRGRGKSIDSESTPDSDPGSRQRRSMTPLKNDTTTSSEPKRSQRLSLSRDGQETPQGSKRGKQITIPEIFKRDYSPKSYPSRMKKEDEAAFTKTGKRKKKHFKGLSYSFSGKKKKGKGKLRSGGPDAYQETDSVVSEEVDIESVDSSSQDVPSQLSHYQDQDALDDGGSEVADNDDGEMDNLDTLDGEGEMEDDNIDEEPLGNPEEDAVVDTEDHEDHVLDDETDVTDMTDNMEDKKIPVDTENQSVEEDMSNVDSYIESKPIVRAMMTEEDAASTDPDEEAIHKTEEQLRDVKAATIQDDLAYKDEEDRKSNGGSESPMSSAEEDMKEEPVKEPRQEGQEQPEEGEDADVNLSAKEPDHVDLPSQDTTHLVLEKSDCKMVEKPTEESISIDESSNDMKIENETQSVLVSEEIEQSKSIGKPESLTGPTHETHERLENLDLTAVSQKEHLAGGDLVLRGRRRHSISKRRLEDLGLEGHNSDSSDSIGETRLPAEGVRKSKRLSRNMSPHPLSITAPRSPEGPGKAQSKPVGSQSSYVAAPSLTNVLCKCRIKENPLAVDITGDVYCQAIDSFDGRMIGCCNVVTNYRYQRVSGKIPFVLLCETHRQRLRRHNCCPCCGLFCAQGVFYECSWDKQGTRHYYHKLCGLVLSDLVLCPHCGTEEPPKEVRLELKLNRKPVIYLKQHQERKEASARMTWSKKTSLEDEALQSVSLPEGEPRLELQSGHIISAHKLPLGMGREKLQEAIRSISSGKVVSVKPSAKSVYWACKNNDLEKLLHVLVQGVSPNVKVKEYGNQTGMHVAASYGILAALHVLVLAGATIDMTDTQLMSPLMVAITKEQNDVVHYLIQAGASLMAKTQDGMTCLHLAAKGGNLMACQHILNSGRLTRHAVNMQDEGGWTPLVWASENKFTHVVKYLLDRGGNPQLCDVEQNTALHWGAFSGASHICSMVLDRGCSLRSMNAHGDTPLHIAARQNNTDTVVLLLARGARLDVVNKKGQMPIDCAVPDSDVHLQLSLNSKLQNMMSQNNIRTEKILSSDIAAGKEQVPIPCVNGVNDDLLPRDYLYIAENCEASNVIIDRTITSLKWCECEDGCNTDSCGCGQLNFQCWYDPDGRLLPDFNYNDPPMIFECNRACRCNKLSCNNRVVQHGISAHMQLFKTRGKGWGVRALKTIQKGSYVCEYVGEIITDLEADHRQDDSYLFDLDNRV